jgi:hypothetical protein
MALQNRVDPYGELRATPARGAWMGNRGVLHDASKRIVAVWRLPRWITCVLNSKGRRREVFSPNRYSELFFLDEATSLSAGHRPCAECRRARYEEFREAWASARGHDLARRFLGADAIDRVLQAERLEREGRKKTYRAVLSSLPDGAMVEHAGGPHLIRGRKLLRWSFSGYGPAIDVALEKEVEVLTPPSIVGAIRVGFVPQVAERRTEDRRRMGAEESLSLRPETR